MENDEMVSIENIILEKHITDQDQVKTMRVLLVDGCLIYRNSLAFSLSECQDFKVVGLAATAAQVYNVNFKDKVDLTVVDVDLLDQSGIEMCKWLNSHYPKNTLLLLSDYDWEVYLVAAQQVYSAGLLLRNTPTAEIIQSIRKAKNGTLFSPDQLSRIDSWKKNIGRVLKTLCPREWQVLWQVTTGLNNREIAQKLNISENSIEKYLTGLYQRFGISTRAALMVLIYRYHLDVLSKLDDKLRKELLSG